jgi:formyl-CoA transferase
MALFKRERTGEPSIVDVSLLNVGMWAMSPDIAAAPFTGGAMMGMSRKAPGNVITNTYRTKDNRWLQLVCLQSDRFWEEFCHTVGRADMIDDPKYIDSAARFANREQCVVELDKTFAEKTLEEWKQIFSIFSGVWAPGNDFMDIHDMEQVAANGFLEELTAGDGTPFKLPTPPYQFDERQSTVGRVAPELGQHTEEVLLELGFTWDDIGRFQDARAI